MNRGVTHGSGYGTDDESRCNVEAAQPAPNERADGSRDGAEAASDAVDFRRAFSGRRRPVFGNAAEARPYQHCCIGLDIREQLDHGAAVFAKQPLTPRAHLLDKSEMSLNVGDPDAAQLRRHV